MYLFEGSAMMCNRRFFTTTFDSNFLLLLLLLQVGNATTSGIFTPEEYRIVLVGSAVSRRGAKMVGILHISHGIQM